MKQNESKTALDRSVSVDTSTDDKGKNEIIYAEGYKAGMQDQNNDCNPYSGLDAEFWLDGYDDAQDDLLERD